MDGQKMDIQVAKVHTIAQLVEMSLLEEMSLMLTTNAVFMLESKSRERMLRSCQDNGNSKLDLALGLR
jgi:hypothetical protein